MDCRWCHVPIRERTVLVGQPPGRPSRLFIDRLPHEDGNVLERDDGKFRVLTDGRAARARRTGRQLFRIHGRSVCAPRQQEANRVR